MYRILHRAFCTAAEPATVSIKSISDDLYKKVNLKRLVEKFKKASDIDRFRKKTGIYEKTVRRLAGAKRIRWIRDILEHQKQYSDISNEGFSVRLISLYGKSGMAKHARMVFDEMPHRKCNRTVLSFNALLAAYLHSRKFNVVDGLFKTLPTQLSIEPDLVSYNTLIKAFCEKGSFGSALSVFKEMEEKDVNSDPITFMTLLDGLLREMEKVGVKPDPITFMTLLDGLLREMEKVGVKPDLFCIEVVVHVVIRCCLNHGDLDEVKKCLDMIANFDFDLHKKTYSILVPFLREKCDSLTTFKLCLKILEKRGRVDVSLLQLVVDKLVKEGMISKAKEFVEAWKTHEYYPHRLNLPETEYSYVSS